MNKSTDVSVRSNVVDISQLPSPHTSEKLTFESEQDNEDVTASTEGILSDSLSDIKSTHESTFARRSLLRSYGGGDDSSSSCSTSSFDDDDEDASFSLAHSSSPVAASTPKLDLPLHPGSRHWRTGYDSLSFLRTIESGTENEHSDDESSFNNESDEIAEAESLQLLCSKESNRTKLLGEGAFGQVWLVINGSQAYALKVCAKYDLVTEGATEQVLRERQIHGQLRHPFICRLEAYYQDDIFLYMLQEYCAGGELFSLLGRNGGKLRESSGRFYLACIADALQYLHDSHIVYRDLKPENIMLDQYGYPQLIDFGCAKQFTESDRDESGSYQSHTLCGTPRLVAPEMIEPSRYGGGHSFATDYWALGVLLYEMLMGTNPYEYDGMTEMEVYESIVDEGFQPALSDYCSISANDLLRSLLVHNPTHRLGSKQESQVLGHIWFVNIDMSVLRKRPHHAAPWTPDLSDASDTQYFDDWENILESKFTQSYPGLSVSQRQLFDDF